MTTEEIVAMYRTLTTAGDMSTSDAVTVIVSKIAADAKVEIAKINAEIYKTGD